MENDLLDLDHHLKQRVGKEFTVINNKESIVNYERLIKNEDSELILFELPKNFDKNLLNKMKIRNFSNTNGKINKILNNYYGISYDASHAIPKQTLAMFPNKNKKYKFKNFDRYVKLFEHVEVPNPDTDSIIPRRLIIKKTLGKRKRLRSESQNI